MTKTQRIDALKNIKKRFVSFISISIIIMFGIGGSFATQYLGKGNTLTAAEYYAEHNFMDYEVVSSMGITQIDIDAIKNLEEISDVEGSLALDGVMTRNGMIENVKVMSLTERINTVNLLEGKLPEKENEVAITSDVYKAQNLKIGDEVKLNVTFNDKNLLKESVFKIVGVVQHPYYIRLNSTYCAIVANSAIDQETTNGLYTTAYVRTYEPINVENVVNTDGNEEIKDKIWKLTYDLQKQDVQYFKDLANQKIDEEWAKAEEKFNEAETQITEKETEFETQLANAKRLIRQGRAQLADAKAQLETAQNEISVAEAQLNQAKDLIAKADPIFAVISPDTAINVLSQAKDLASTLKHAIDSGDQELIDKARQAIADWIARDDINEILTKIEEYTKLPIKEALQKASQGTLLSDTITYLNKGVDLTKQYVEYKPRIPEYEQKIADGKVQIAQGWNEYNSGLAQVNAKEKEMKAKEAEVRAQIADAKAQLAEAKEDAIKKVELAREEAEKLDVNLLVTGRNGNTGFLEVNSNITTIQSAGLVFGILFLVITALVCFSTLAIMVEEDKKQVGTTKAFGFYNREILMKYLYYGVSAAIIGSVLGVALAFGIAYFVNYQMLKVAQYGFGLAKTVIAVPQTIAVVLLSVLVCGVTTVISCYVLMKTPASLLLKDETITSRNKKLKKRKNAKAGGSLYSHLIIKNMLDEKARVSITILIVAASLAIIAVGFSIKFGFDGMFEKQIHGVYNYDYRVAYTADVSEEMIEEVKKYFDDNNIPYLPAAYEAHLYNDDNNVDGLFIISADANKINDFFNIRDPKTKEVITLPDNGLIVQDKFVETRGMVPGKQFRLLDSSLHYHEAVVVGSFENYQGRLVLVSTEAYRNIFTEKPTYNSFYIRLNGVDEEKMMSALSKISKDISFEPADNLTAKYGPFKSLYNIIVYILTSMAIVMSFMIITNLANIFVTRKKKELIVMRINGFSIRQTIAYLARETIITVAIGLIIGLFAAVGLSMFAINLMEPLEIRFDHTLRPITFIVAFSLETIFAFTINFLAFRKVKHLSFRDITS